MHDDEAASFADIFFERLPDFLGPAFAVVIADDHIVFAEVWPPCFPLRGCFPFDACDCFFPAFELLDIVFLLIFPGRNSRLAGNAFRGGGDFDGEAPGILENLLENRRRQLPLMIILSVNEQNRKFILLRLFLSLLLFLIGLVGSQAGNRAAGNYE